MKQPLLQKTLRIYAIYSIVALLIIAPIFYFTIDKLYIDDADDSLKLKQEEFDQSYLPSFTIAEVEAWNKYNRDTKLILNTRGIKAVVLSDEIYYDELDEEYEPYRVLASPIMIEGQAYLIAIRTSLVEKEDLIEVIAFVFLGLILVLILGLIIIFRFYARRLWQPFYNSLSIIEKFEVDKQQQVDFSPNDIDEFTRLDQAIEKLIQKNSDIYHGQKEFIENAAQEMQTPLAVFKGKLELLAQQPEMTETQSVLIADLDTSVSRLSKINKNLLLLSRIDNHQFSDMTSVNVKTILAKQFDFYAEQAATKSIELIQRDNLDLIISSNSVLVEIAIGNLILNAIKHNHAGGIVYIDVDRAGFAVSNTSVGQSLDEHVLFERFAKSDHSTTGTGLGLSIVKRIVDFNNWKIDYSFKTNMHIFSIKC